MAEFTVDLRNLPTGAFREQLGSKGQYYVAEYQLGLHFGSDLLFKFHYNGRVIGSAQGRYL
jgi:hypothetical protein